MKVRILPEAFSDLEEGSDWYEVQQNGLGSEFEDEFYRALEFVAAHPLAARPVYKKFRRRNLNRFLYSVYYQIYREIVVALLFHGMRDPKRLRKMLRSRSSKRPR